MSYQIKKHLEDHYIIVEYGEDYDVELEIESSIADGIKIYDSLGSPIFVILDFTKTKMDLQDVIVGANVATREGDSPFSHPNVRQTLFVTKDRALKLSTKGMKHEIFGGHNLPAFESIENALAYVRSKP